MSTRDERPPNAEPEARSAGSLTREMEALRGLVRELEDQLGRLMELNSRLEREISLERQRSTKLEHGIDQLRARKLSEHSTDVHELELQAEILRRERTELAAASRHQSARLREVGAERGGQVQARRLLEQERAAALSELSNVESQLERALSLIARAEAALQIREQEIEALRTSVRDSEQKLLQLRREREELTADIRQSSAALEKLRRSLGATRT
jgi:chromosome segregation ATPase